ncbi:MAG: DNA polymerase III subunit beta [Gemella sp.]|nr:DNA polymerase III subunit beta [Gemella sp.]
MKFTILKNNFLDALNTVARVIAPTPAFDILKGIKIELLEDKMVLTASDSLVSMEYTIDSYIDDKEVITIDETGQAVIPSKNFIEIIKKAPTDEIFIEVINQQIKIKSGNSEFNLLVYDADEYPELPLVAKENNFKIPSTVFNSIVKETLFCTAINDQRPILEGVNFVLENKTLTATSTDSHRMSKRKLVLEDIDLDKEFNMIVPRKALQYIQRIAEGQDNILEIYYEENRILFVLDHILYNVSLISGKYPNTDKLIPQNYECSIDVNSKELYDGVDRVSLVSRSDKDDIVKLQISNGKLNLSSNSKELGSAEEEVDVMNIDETNDFEIAVSAKFLKDAISAVASENVLVKFSGELTAFTIQPSDNHRDIIQVLLPVRTY